MKKEVIIACDFKNEEELFNFLKLFDDERPFLKIGMEIFYKEGPNLVRKLKKLGYKIFLDLKLCDIPNTVSHALLNLKELDVDIVNVHAFGGFKMLTEAKKALEGSNTKLIAVTILTSLDEEAIHNELKIQKPLKEVVYDYAKMAKEAGLDGIVCSPYEAPLAKELGLMSITPGIRLSGDEKGDQKRVTTPKDASKLGSTYIVVGRSITRALDPKKAYLRAMEEFNDECK